MDAESESHDCVDPLPHGHESDHLCHGVHETVTFQKRSSCMSRGTTSESRLAWLISTRLHALHDKCHTGNLLLQLRNRIMTLALFRVAAEPKMIHSRADRFSTIVVSI